MLWLKLFSCALLVTLVQSGYIEDMKKVIYDDAVCEPSGETCAFNIYLDPPPRETKWRKYKSKINVNVSLISEELVATIQVKQGVEQSIVNTNLVGWEHRPVTFDCFDGEEGCKRVTIDIMRGDVHVVRNNDLLTIAWCPLIYVREYRVGPRSCFWIVDDKIQLTRVKNDYYWVDFDPYDEKRAGVVQGGSGRRIGDSLKERFNQETRNTKKRPPQ